MKHLVYLMTVILMSPTGCYKSTKGFLDDTDATNACGLAFDINERDNTDRIISLTSSGNNLFFVVSSPQKYDLWVTDGTESETKWLHEGTNPVSNGSGKVFFWGVKNETGTEPWISDGTASGTRIIKDIVPGPNSSGVEVALSNVIAMESGSFVFVAYNNDVSYQLWISDGTESGTHLTSPINASNIKILGSLGDLVLFLTFEEQPTLWASNVTDTSTIQIGSFSAQMSSRFRNVKLGDLLLMSTEGVDDSTGEELWRTDGTLDGTFLLKDILPGQEGSSPERLVTMSDRAYFNASDQLWSTDGTTQGTTFCNEKNPHLMVAGKDRLYFLSTGSEEGVWNLYTTEGCFETPNLLETFSGDIIGEISLMHTIGNTLYFSPFIERGVDSGRHGLWTSDGTQNGTFRLRDTRLGIGFADLNEVLIYSAKTDDNGFALWRSDGTSIGTQQVVDIFHGNDSSFPSDLVALDSGRLIFEAHNGLDLYPVPFVLDLRKQDAQPQSISYETNNVGYTIEGIVEIGEKIYFVNTGSYEFLRVDNSSYQATSFLKAFGLDTVRESLKADKNNIYFTATNINDNQFTFYKSDGTPNGTSIVREDAINVEHTESLSAYKASDSMVYFASNDLQTGLSLWRTDGSTNETTMIKALCPSEEDRFGATHVSNFMAAGDLFYFFNTDVDCNPGLWRSDGTKEGTFLLRYLIPSPSPSGWESQYVLLDDVLCFLAQDGEHGTELWRSDGTVDGTFALRGDFDRESDLVVLNHKLYFLSYSGTQMSIWTSDGTNAGTTSFGGFSLNSIKRNSLALIDGALYFQGCDDEYGCELWTSDGTVNGTHLFSDLVPGPGSSGPQKPVVQGSRMYFSAQNDTQGRELWYCNIPRGD